MDSLTQIVLGAAVGEAVLGRKIGNRAMLYGAIAGTIPDFDVLASHVTDTVSALEIHRGFTHSIFFSVVFAPFFAWLVTRYDTHKSIKDWSWLFFWAFITHPILDAHTTWGTQLFWPFDLRLAFKTIFVIDPLYTLPFLMCVILAMLQHRSSKKRRFYNRLGLILSTTYLGLTLVFKGMAYTQFEKALKEQGIAYRELETKPSALNSILWCANVETENAYLIGYYSFFDSQPITFVSYSKNHDALGELKHSEKIQRMIAISKGWYTISKKEGQLYFNDLRFGLLSIQPDAKNFVFSYLINVTNDGKVNLIEAPKGRREGKKLMKDLWQRIKGN